MVMSEKLGVAFLNVLSIHQFMQGQIIQGESRPEFWYFLKINCPVIIHIFTKKFY